MGEQRLCPGCEFAAEDDTECVTCELCGANITESHIAWNRCTNCQCRGGNDPNCNGGQEVVGCCQCIEGVELR